TLSIAIKENTYQELKLKIGLGKISSFVNQAVEKGLSELAQEEKKKKDELKKKLIAGYQIAGYQRKAKNKKLQKELKMMEAAQFEDWKDE
ncbi:8238_t:CDS:1, partial [Paraglomus brasilianum]